MSTPFITRKLLLLLALTGAAIEARPEGRNLTSYVNPMLGTATLWDIEDLHYVRHKKTRTWGAEVFPGSSLPNAMVQLSPVTMYGSGAGYQYEDSLIYGFAHTNKGHWNLLHVPMMAVSGRITPDDYASPFSHTDEEAHPGYYRVRLKRYGVTAEMTSTLRCAYHRYTYEDSKVPKRLLVDITRSNNRVGEWQIQREAEPNAFSGMQQGDGRIYFYAVANRDIASITQVQGFRHSVSMVDFTDAAHDEPLELQIGFSFVSIEGARRNLEAEMKGKSFAVIRQEANAQWETLLGKMQVEGGTERQKGLFYSCLYRSMLWPALRSDVNGDYTDARGNIVNTGHHYYTDPSFWDDYRNKLILIGLLAPEVTTDIIHSIIDKGEKRGGYMPTFFHGDHASTFVAGSYLRGLTDFDLNRAYKLMLQNATVPGRGGRPYLDEYLRRGWIAEKDTVNVPYYDEYKAAVTKTVEYAYDDYATALVAKAVGDKANYERLMARSKNYRNVFDPSTGFYRGRTDNGEWVRQFDPYYAYFAYMYREANAWQSLFYAPHDPMGVVALYPSKRAVEMKLDSLFSEPWNGMELENVTGFIGNYCHGNQPGHSQPYMYYFVGKQEKAQAILDSLMNHYYDMGREHLAYSGMDDAGEMSAWFVLNAIGLYTYSPADPEYIVSVPLFARTQFEIAPGHTLTINRNGKGRRIKRIRIDGRKQKGWFVKDKALKQAARLDIDVD